MSVVIVIVDIDVDVDVDVVVVDDDDDDDNADLHCRIVSQAHHGVCHSYHSWILFAPSCRSAQALSTM